MFAADSEAIEPRFASG